MSGTMPTTGPKQYLGDAVYVDFEDGMLVLTTEYGLGPTNKIYLEPEVYMALVDYVDSLKERHGERSGS